MNVKLVAASLVVSSVVAIGYAQDTSLPVSGFDVAVASDGSIKLPDVPFRTTWTQLGSWTVVGDADADGMQNAGGMHIVYTQPGVAEAYQATGAFPDGTVLVKELRGAATEDMTTGRVAHATDLQGWFVMVKDTQGRYPDNPLWGDGWGWGFFEAGAPQTLITQDYQAECLSCHVPAQDTDWIYVRGYPALAD